MVAAQYGQRLAGGLKPREEHSPSRFISLRRSRQCAQAAGLARTGRDNPLFRSPPHTQAAGFAGSYGGLKIYFRGEKRKNETHESTTDRDARLFTKSRGSEAKLSYMGHVLMENRNGLLVQTFLTEATGRAERDAAMLMAEAIPAGKRVTLGGDKNYDTQEFVRELRGMNITLHVAQNTTNRKSAVDERTTRHAGYEVSQRKRKRVEQLFGWMKMIGMLKKVKLRGIAKVGWLFTFTGAAYNLCRLRNLMAKT